MNLALWIVTGLFAAAFLAGGAVKLVLSKEGVVGLGSATGWAKDFSPGSIKLMGAVEILGALGMVLPALFGVARFLVPLAALGLMLYMAGAGTVRLQRQEFGALLGDLAFLAAFAFVAWGRAFGAESFVG